MSIDWAKPGTKAVIDRPKTYGGGGKPASAEIVVVTRETPAQVFVGDRKFRKSDGKELGGKGELKPISTLVNHRFHEAASAIRRRLDLALRGGQVAALADVADLVAAALADIDELEAPDDCANRAEAAGVATVRVGPDGQEVGR